MRKTKIDKLIFEWILFILAPPVTLILTIEFTKALWNLGIFYGILMFVGGIIAFILEVIGLIQRTKETLSIK